MKFKKTLGTALILGVMSFALSAQAITFNVADDSSNTEREFRGGYCSN